MEPGGESEASWSNASGTHVMTVKQAITKVPPSKAEVVAGQIHDDEDDVVMVRLEKKRLFVEADGDDIGALDADYDLGTTFTIVMKATANGIEITYNGVKTVRHDKWAMATTSRPAATRSRTHSHDDDDAFGEVVVYALDVEHS